MIKTVILANGKFPDHKIPKGYLNTADRIICCDGSVSKLISYGLVPNAIVGDMDSINNELLEKFSDILYIDSDDQGSNDLTKAVKHCISAGTKQVVILGATGLREDHTLANISLLADYADSIAVEMLTDFGFILPINSDEQISSHIGQQVSVFAIDNDMKITSTNLKYPLLKTELSMFWMGTLNECTADYFSLSFPKGRILVFLEF